MDKLKEIIEYAEDITVLYVEDDEDARQELSGLLGIFFKKIIVAKNGKEGLESFKNSDIDLVISDITMPVMNGLEMMHHLRSQAKEFKAIFITASSGKDILLDSIELNIDGYILKPISQVQLITILSKIINVIHSEKVKQNFDAQLQIELKKQKATIEKQSNRLIEMLQKDSMTNLYNFEKLKIDYVNFTKKPTLMLVNIDNFNFINLTHSYKTGDEIIKQVAQFLKTFSTNEIKIYKLYGDEFMMLLENIDKIEEALVLAENIKSEFDKYNYFVDDEEFNLSASIAILECLDEDETLPYNKVKLALQNGRNSHKNSISVYRENMSLIEKQKELLKWAKKTKDAIKESRLKAFYQPMYEFKEERITKYEALARIVEGDEIITPFYFLESAKLSGLLPALTKSIVNQTFELFKDFKGLSFSINITDEDLKDGNFFETLLALCYKYEINPSNITLEILENINDSDVENVTLKLGEIRDAGFLLALDDFGAQNSNFTRIQNLNVDIIKIDGLFIKDLDTNLNSRHIVETIIYLAKKTNKRTVAEFVHSRAIFDLVRELGIDYAQGYFVGKPLLEVV
ncbi:MAG: EAL domain-containing protein [Campylobacterales bacterium]|nr:EAL domain-containing protein [Campylobacterales bacterium]